MIKYVLYFLLFACSWANAAFDKCNDQFLKQPPVIENQKLLDGSYQICYNGFAVFYSGVSKTPVYSAQYYQFDAEQDHSKRSNQFHADKSLPAKDQVSPSEYVGTGYDKGHATPYGNMHTIQQKYDSFVMTNVFPQAAQLNRGAWRNLEEHTRKSLDDNHQSAYIITGVIFDGDKQGSIHGIMIPDYVYKVVYVLGTGEKQAYLAENTNTAVVNQVPIEVVEKMAGIQFFKN